MKSLLTVIFLFSLCVCSYAKPPFLTLDQMFLYNNETYVNNIPGGAPPTNDGYAYSNLAYNKFYINMAGQNGYDVCGNPLPLGPATPAFPWPNPTDRVERTFYNVKAIMECFNEPLTQIPKNTVYESANFSFVDNNEKNNYFIQFRAIVNNVQRYPQFWGSTASVPARTITGIEWLSLGDVFEVSPDPTARTNELPTCLDTGIPPPTALYLLAVDTAAGRFPCPTGSSLHPIFKAMGFN